MTELEKFYNTLYGNIGLVLLVVRILVLLAGVWKWKFLNRPLRIFWFYLLALIVYNLLERGFVWSVNNYTDAWLPYLEKYKIGDTNFLNIIGVVLNYIFLGWVYGHILPEKWSGWVRRVSWVLVVVALVVYVWLDGFRTYGNINAILNRAFLIGGALTHLWFLYQSLPTLNLWKNSYFLISLGLLVTNLPWLFLSFVGDKTNTTDGVLFLQLSTLRHAFTLVSLLLFAYAFHQARYARFLTKEV